MIRSLSALGLATAALMLLPALPMPAQATPADAASAPAAANASAPRPPAGPIRRCTAVFGRGLNRSPVNVQYNASWNNVNTAFNSAVSDLLRERGWPVSAFVVPVEGNDIDKMFTSIVRLAGAEECDSLVVTSVFADEPKQLFVARLSAYRLVREGDAGGPARFGIGAPLFERAITEPLSKKNMEGLDPVPLAKVLAGQYFAATGR